jgi:hypothetical protein
MVAAQFAPLQASEDLWRLGETLIVGSAAQLQLVAGPNEGVSELAKVAAAERELALIETPEDADLLRRKVEALIAVARKARREDIEVEWPELLRLRLDAWRKWGELLGPSPGPGGDTSNASDRASDAEYKNRERARKLAALPEEKYREYRARNEIDRLTLAGLLSMAHVGHNKEGEEAR